MVITLASSMPSALIVSVAVRDCFPVFGSVVTTISETSELDALMAGVALHHCRSLLIVHGVLGLIFKNTLLGEEAVTVYASCASMRILSGPSEIGRAHV